MKTKTKQNEVNYQLQKWKFVVLFTFSCFRSFMFIAFNWMIISSFKKSLHLEISNSQEKFQSINQFKLEETLLKCSRQSPDKM